MKEYLIKLHYILLIMPAFSVFYLVTGIYFQNRFAILPILLLSLFFNNKLNFGKYQIPIFVLIQFFIMYIFISYSNGWNILIYLGYFLTVFLVLLTTMVINFTDEHFILFFKNFFLINIGYVIVQSFFLNIGMNELSMLHSNLPAQANYSIPVFISEPFYRYTGLFNESSAFAFYLTICFAFFQVLGEKYKKFKICTLIFLILSGSKTAYLFLILHYSLFSRYKIFRIIIAGLFCSIVYLFMFNVDMLRELSYGEIASVFARLQWLDSIDDSPFGSGLGKSSEGEVDLNMFSILLSGFGYVGTTIIFSCIVLFYILINNSNKKLFIIPFLVGALSNGSLLIFQYTLLIYCLIYLTKQNRKNILGE